MCELSMLGQRAHSFTCPCDDENDVMRVSASIRWSSSCRKSPGHDGASPLAVRRVYIQPYSRDNRAPGAPRCPCRWTAALASGFRALYKSLG